MEETMSKRIILLLDGTWNDIDEGPYDTNIVRMRELISKHLVEASNDGHLNNNIGNKKVHGYAASGKEHIIYYERGVGTGAFDWLNGGAFGDGLSRNIRQAYKFLSFWYEPGDEIFIYGFSRGAYTARSLVGYLAAAGLLRQDACSEELESLAWQYYRSATNDRMPAVWRRLTDYVHNRSEFRVKLIGVFDTVGALGIPVGIAWRFNREEHGFHDVELSSITDVNLHALAIDEHRRPFEAALWRMPAFKKYETVVEQVWFSGAHADVGGGYIVEESRDPGTAYADDITLDWMMRRTKHFYPDFPFDIDRSVEKITEGSSAALHNSRRSLYLAWPFAIRSIANCNTGANRWMYQREVSRDRHARPIGEMVHISAIERLLSEGSGGPPGDKYKAANLAKVIDHIKKIYEPKRNGESERTPGPETGPNHRTFELPVVDWDGSQITKGCRRAEQLRLLLNRHNQQGRSEFGLRNLFHAFEAWLPPKPSARL
jgi:type VI secretion system (T6SS) phospholipase Tle1-like effector